MTDLNPRIQDREKRTPEGVRHWVVFLIRQHKLKDLPPVMGSSLTVDYLILAVLLSLPPLLSTHESSSSSSFAAPVNLKEI